MKYELSVEARIQEPTMIPEAAVETVGGWPWSAYRQYQDAPRGRSYEWLASIANHKATK